MSQVKQSKNPSVVDKNSAAEALAFILILLSGVIAGFGTASFAICFSVWCGLIAVGVLLEMHKQDILKKLQTQSNSDTKNS
jgi:hypothetical protein